MSTQTDNRKPESPAGFTPSGGSGLSSFAEKILGAMRRLTKERVPHPCGGFTTDDLEWQMGTAFTPQEKLDDAIEQLSAAHLIRHAGYDDDDAIGHCYELVGQNEKGQQ